MASARTRCSWVPSGEKVDALYERYHDEEWGVPVLDDDRKLFEMLVLESNQAGLSWRTILHKRSAFRMAYVDFDIQAVAAMTEQDVDRLVSDKGIIRHRGKIQAAIGNARVCRDIQKEWGSLGAYFWSYMPRGMPLVNRYRTIGEVPTSTDISDALSMDLKKRGCKFVGSTTMYAFMQAVGMVNDHMIDCFRYREVQ